MTIRRRHPAKLTVEIGVNGKTPSQLRVYSYRLGVVRFSPGQPAFTHACADERAPGHEITGEPPGAHPNGRHGRDQFAFETSFPECHSPHIGPLRMVHVPVQEQYTQGIEVPQEALLVWARLIPVAQDVSWYPDWRLRLLRRRCRF